MLPNKFSFKRIVLAVAALSFILWVSFAFNSPTRPERVDRQIALGPVSVDHAPSLLAIAFVADIHLEDSPQSRETLKVLLDHIAASGPDMVLLGGDYVSITADKIAYETSAQHFVDALSVLNSIPIYAVLGNHEQWSDPRTWKQKFSNAGVKLIENEVSRNKLHDLCIRGFGDYFTSNHRFTEFPHKCEHQAKITLAHDPASAFQVGVEGLVLAGHTHCGQVRLPFIKAPWTPTDAPQAAHCGYYEDDIRKVLVTSGIGTSLLPIRIGTRSQWEFITLHR